MSTPTPITPNQATGSGAAPQAEGDVESFINEYYAAWQGTDEDQIMAYYSEDVTVQIPGSLMQGHTAVREQFVRPYITGFPRNRHLVKHMICGPDEVTVEFTFDAQHTGPFAGYAATDAHVQVAGCGVYQYDLARRQITTARIYFDVATLLKQLLDPIYSHRITDGSTAQPTVTMAAPTEHVDLATVIAVSQAVSGETVLERLLDTLMQTAVRKKDGSRVPVLPGATLFDGTADEGVAFVVDLTERKRAEQVAQERERESRQIVDTIPGLVAILTPTGEVDVVNHELVEYCGQPLEAMRQWGTNGTVHPDDLPHVGQVFGPAIAAGTPYDFDARIRRFDGVYRWCQVRGLPLRNTNGGITRWYVVLTDIDERKRAEHALRDSERNSPASVRIRTTRAGEGRQISVVHGPLQSSAR